MILLKDLTKKQEEFIKIYSALFNIKDAKGNVKPFIPSLFQQQVLRDSILCNPDNYKNRIVNKGRGIGLTALVAGEIVLASIMMPGITIPVASIIAKTANVLIDWCIYISDNCNELYGCTKVARDTTISSIVKFDNGSKIIPISGHSPNSIRSLRAPILVLDEFAFNEYQKEILSAGERCLSEGGQMTIISTPRTTDVINDEFWRIWMKADELDYIKYEFPIFDPHTININKSLLEQNLTPLAPWIDINQLEKDRRRDALMFSRENLCMPLDESVAFLSWELIKKCCILPKDTEILEHNPIYVGIDVGRVQDLTAIEIFQLVDGVFYHVGEHVIRGMTIPNQVDFIVGLHAKYRFDRINIDKTGLGLGLFEYCRKEIGGKVHGVQFTKDVKVQLANNLRSLIQDDKIFLMKDDDLMDDLHAIPYDTLDAPKSSSHHSDRFWSCCLAVSEPKTRYIDAGKMLDGFL